MKREPAVTVELVRGGGGVFDVVFGEEVVFSKHAQGRFPEPGEILTLVRARRTSGAASRDA